MLHLAETLKRLPATALRWGIGRDKLRMCVFKLYKALVKLVVFVVADDRGVQRMVQIVVVMQLLTKVVDLFLEFVFTHNDLEDPFWKRKWLK